MDACGGFLRHVSPCAKAGWRVDLTHFLRLIALNVHSEINCQALYNFNQFGGNSALGASSTL
jgi:hypothetical protein